MLVIPGLIVPGHDRDLRRQHPDPAVQRLARPSADRARRHVPGATFRCARCRGSPCCASSCRLALEQSARFAWHVLSLPVAFFSQRYTGDLVNRVEANDRVATLLARDFGNAAASCLTAAFLGVVMISYDAILAAIVIGGAALNVAGAPPRSIASLADVALRLQTEQRPAVLDLGRRTAVDRDAQGDRRRERLLLASGRAITPAPSIPSRSSAIYQQTIDLRAARPAQPDVGRRARHRRPAGHRRRPDDRNAGGVPGPADELLRRRSSRWSAWRAGCSRRRPTCRGSTTSCTTGATGASRKPPAAPPEARGRRPSVDAGRQLRLQSARAAADREFLARRGAGPVGGAGRRIGQRQVHPGQAHHRPVRAALGRDPHRRPYAAAPGAASGCRTSSPRSTRTSVSSAARSTTMSRCGTTRSIISA